MSTKICPTCKATIDAGARTCPKCGKTFTTAGGVLVAVIVGLVLAGIFFGSR